VQNSKGGKKYAYIFGTTIVSSVVFFLVTNFGVWTSDMFYEMNFNGLIQCYTMALPFFRNSLAGDLFYAAAMFGLYEFASRFIKQDSLQEAKVRK
jgi:hypothetical protein